MDLAGRRVVVMGLGRFGGGVGVTRYLARQGARVVVTDRLGEGELRDSLGKIADLKNVTYRLAGHAERDFREAELVVANPAVPPDNEYLAAARAASVPVTSEIRLLTQRLPDRRRVIGVTGSAGKSTVTAMIGHILKRCVGSNPKSDIRNPRPPRVWVGGNLGGSLLECLDDIAAEDWVVLELSSFMLHGLAEDRWSPHIAVVTNIAPNHLDWHGSFEAYVAAKQAIFDHQQPGDIAVLGAGVTEHLRPGVGHVIEQHVGPPLPGTRICEDLPELPLNLPGAHNVRNAVCALDALWAVGITGADAAAALADFTGLPHRLQLVAEHAGVRCYNDSKATTPEAARLAIASFDAGCVHAILGGYDKGSDLAALARFARAHCRAIYTIGGTGEVIADAAEAGDGQAEVVRAGELDAAVGEIARRARRGDVVLLSPGCASWDQFASYEQRGARFVEAVLRHLTETGKV